MNYYLVEDEKLFIDPHGSADDGGTLKYVVKTERDIDTKLIYKESIHEYDMKYSIDEIWTGGDEDEEEYEGSEDGYNMIYHRVKYVKLTDEKYKEYSKIIQDYNKL